MLFFHKLTSLGRSVAASEAPSCSSVAEHPVYARPGRQPISLRRTASVGLVPLVLLSTFLIARPCAAAQSTVSSLFCGTSTFTGAGTDNCTVTLAYARYRHGRTVSLSSSDPAVQVPASVYIPRRSSSASFTATVSAVSTTQAATISASEGGVTRTTTLQLDAAAPAWTIAASSLAFGGDNLNMPVSKSVLIQSTGTTPLTIRSGTVTGTGFSISGLSFPATLSPGQSATLTIKFDPTAAGADSGTVTLVSNAASGGTATIGLSGTGVAATTLHAVSCTSGSVTGATTDACSVTLTGAAPSSGLAVTLTSSNSAVKVPASVTVAAGATTAAFTATATAVTTTQTATITASAGGVSTTFALQLTAGSGPAWKVASSSIAFGNVSLNTTATQSVLISSTGSSALTISSGTISGTGFKDSGLTFPVTLNPGQSATLNIAFDPTTATTYSGTVKLMSNATTGGTVTLALTGTGQAASYSVDLTWDAPAPNGDAVTGYSVYRSSNGGTSYSLMNSAADANATYTDTTVTNGTSYKYYVESVDAKGNRSGPSNTWSIAIP